MKPTAKTNAEAGRTTIEETLTLERNWDIKSWWTAHDDTVAHCHYALIRDPEQVTWEEAKQLVLV